MATVEITGTVKEFLAPKTWESNGKSGTNRWVVIDTEEKYDSFFCIQFGDDKTELFKGIKLGDVVKVNFNISSTLSIKNDVRNYFQNFRLWKIEKVAAKQEQQWQKPAPDPLPLPKNQGQYTPEQTDDLPF